LSLLTFVLGCRYGAFVAGGPDPYGYVSQAALWRNGTLIVDAPMSDSGPWARWAFTPLGYVPSDTPGAMVPQYPPGLPMVMAVFQSVVGEQGAYFVVPLLGALAVWLTYKLGKAIAGSLAGLIAAVLLVASPVFLWQLMFPMSDVPATAWWLLAVVLALESVRRPPDAAALALSGLAATMAVMTRPNLALLGPVVFLFVIHGTASWRERFQRALIWGVPALIGPAVMAWIHLRLYGSPFRSGYGDTAALFAFANVGPNLERYSSWFVSTQTPFIFFGVLALPLVTRRWGGISLRIATWALVCAAVVVLSYLWYLPFDHWTFLRFLLPAFPMLLATAAATLLLIAGNRPGRRALAAALMVVVVAHCLDQAKPAFGIKEVESHYLAAAEATQSLPADAIVISNLHSGSVRYYANRLTLRFELLDPSDYQRALQLLRERRRPVYALLDQVEIDQFRSRYAAVADLSWLDGLPMRTIAGRVELYALPE
jgi:4-amino-4-deoxy-L-arabinose transferase-like glycosyltransferase